MRPRALLLIVASVALACEEPDLSEALSKGRCDSNGECATGYTCVDQQCEKAGTGGEDGQAGTGPCSACTGAGMACCDDQCVDVSANPLHCNGCNQPCPGTVCADFACRNPPDCLPGFLDCDANVVTGCEVEADECPKPTDAGAG